MVKTLDKLAWQLLCETAPSRVADAVEGLARRELAEIDASLAGALAGDREHVSLYVAAHGRLADRVLEALGDTGRRPEEAPWLRTVLRGEATTAPFSAWVGSLEPGRGTAVAMVDLLRQTLAAGRPVSPPARRRLPVWDLTEADVLRFFRAVTAILEGAELPLERIQEILALSRTGAAELFGVRRQALEGWERNGVPAERRTKLATIGAIVDLLSVQLKADRVAAVARRPAPAYGDRSILAAIAAGEEEQVLERLRSGFDWASNG